jgi:ribosomal protein L11 methyltransferase
MIATQAPVSWTSLQFTVSGRDAEAWADALLEAGALSVDVLDASAGTADEVPQFGEPGEFAPGVWASNLLSALFDAGADPAAIVAAVAAAHGWRAPVVYTLTRVEEQDWVRLTQAQFEPMRIAERLWVIPSWHVPPDPAAINIVVDPGLAFGTGSHPTTRLCLRWLEARLAGGESVLDYGCGSGILAIAAMRLGARDVIGTDLDPQALVAAEGNTRLNAVAATFVLPDALPAGTFDVVIANILTNPLRVLAPALAARTRSGGRIVLSGILEDQADDVIDAYRPWFNIAVWQIDEGWVALEGTRRQASAPRAA